MDDVSRDVRITKVTPEEAQAFRERVRKQREEFLTNWVVIPIDEVIELLGGGRDEGAPGPGAG